MNWQSGVSYIYFICWFSKSTSDTTLSKKKEKRTGCGWLFSLFCGLPLEGCSHWEPYLADIPDSSAVKCSDAKELGSSGDSHPRLTGDLLLTLPCHPPIVQWEQKPRNINTDQEWQNLSNSKLSLSSLPFTPPPQSKRRKQLFDFHNAWKYFVCFLQLTEFLVHKWILVISVNHEFT